MVCRMPNQAPMSSTRSASGRRACVTILYASRRISATLLSRANRGASGNAATNSVTKPYCSTGGRETGRPTRQSTSSTPPRRPGVGRAASAAKTHPSRGIRRTEPAGRGPAAGSPPPSGSGRGSSPSWCGSCDTGCSTNSRISCNSDSVRIKPSGRDRLSDRAGGGALTGIKPRRSC